MVCRGSARTVARAPCRPCRRAWPQVGAAAAHGDDLGAVVVGVLDLEARVAVVAVAALVGLGRLEHFHRDGAAAVLVQGPLRDVQVVRAPVGHLAAGVVVPPAELVVAVRLLALLAIGDLRGRAEPEVPVQALGDRRFRDRAARRVAVDAALDGLDLADAAGADQLDRQAEHAAEIGSLLAAGLQDAAGVLDRLLDRQRLGDGQRQRLLAVDVLAGLEGLDGDLGMPVVGRGDEQAIERLVVDEVAVSPRCWPRSP